MNECFLLLLFQALIHPSDEILCAAAGAFGFNVLLSPYGSEIHAFHAVVIFKSKRKVHLGRYRCVALRDTRSYAPVFCNCARTAAL